MAHKSEHKRRTPEEKTAAREVAMANARAVLNDSKQMMSVSAQELICQQVYGLVLESARIMHPKDDEDGLELLFLLLKALAADCGAKAEFTKQLLQQHGRDVPRRLSNSKKG